MRSRAECLLEAFYDVDNDVKGTYDRLNLNKFEDNGIEYADNTLLLMRCELLMGKTEFIHKNFDKILSIYEAKGDKVGEFFTLSLYGLSCRIIEDITEATRVLNRAYKLSFELDDFNLIIIALVNHICLDENAASDSVIELFEDARKYVKELGHGAIIGSYYLNYGYLLFLKGRYDEALASYDKSLAAYRSFYKNPYASNIMAVMANRAEIYLKYGENEKAIAMFEELYQRGKEANDNNVIYDALKSLSIAYEEVGDYTKAFEYLKLLNKQILSYKQINSEDNSKKINEYLSVEIEDTKDKIILANLELKKKTLELEANLKRLNLISEIGKKLTSTTDEAELFHLITDMIYENMKVDFIGLFLVNQRERTISLKYTIDKDEKEWSALEISFDNEDSFSSYCAREGKDVYTNNLQEEMDKYVKSPFKKQSTKNKEEKIESMIYCRLLSEGKLIGLLTVQSAKKNAFDLTTYKTIESISSYASIALSNSNKSRLLEQKSVALEKLSYYDGLTRLENRRSFNKYTETLEANPNAYKTVGFIIADMNHLKLINDNISHIEGDRYLVEVANLLEKAASGGKVFRLSGDEFGVIMLNIDVVDLISYIQKVKESCKNKEFEPYPLSLAMGYAYAEQFEMRELFYKAETMMYADKSEYYKEKKIDRREHS